MGNDKHQRTRTLVIASMLTAIIFLSTYYVKFPVPKAPGAYVNIGDSVIYISGVLLAFPWAAGAAAIGSMLADIMYGGGWYIPATFVIKGLMGLVASLFLYRKKKENGQKLKLAHEEKEQRRFFQVCSCLCAVRSDHGKRILPVRMDSVWMGICTEHHFVQPDTVGRRRDRCCYIVLPYKNDKGGNIDETDLFREIRTIPQGRQVDFLLYAGA